MERIELIQKLMKEHTRSAAVTVSFLDKPRKYGMENSLFMREVHFVVEIGPEGSPTMGELAQRLNVTQGAVTQMAIRLEKKGYVARAKDAGDKRVTTGSLTEKGRILCEKKCFPVLTGKHFFVINTLAAKIVALIWPNTLATKIIFLTCERKH